MMSLLMILSLAGAVVLPEVRPASAVRLPVDPAPIACDQILDRLQTYHAMAREHDLSVTNFLGEVTGRVADWYSLLSPLEGKMQAIPAGTFRPLENASNEITNVTNLAYDNSDILRVELENILTAMRGCSVGTPRAQK